jgi:hypothetical protein
MTFDVCGLSGEEYDFGDRIESMGPKIALRNLQLVNKPLLVFAPHSKVFLRMLKTYWQWTRQWTRNGEVQITV